MPYFEVELRRQRRFVDVARLRVQAEDQNEAEKRAVAAAFAHREREPTPLGVAWLTIWLPRSTEYDVTAGHWGVETT